MEKSLPDTRPFAAFEWMLAARYLRARRREGFISVISLFSFLGILLGVATLIVVMAVLNGFRGELLDKILGFQGHASVYHSDISPIRNYVEIQERLSKIPGVTRVVALVEGQAMASSLRNNTGALVRGISEADIQKLPSLNNENLRTAFKQEGVQDETASFVGFDASGGIAIGERMAWRHQLGLGSRLTIISPEGPDTVMGTAPRIRDYPVVAIFKVGMSDYDENVVYMPMAEAQDYFVTEEGVSQIEVMVEKPDEVEELVLPLMAEAGADMTVNTWKERNMTFFNALAVERNVMFLVLTMIILVAALNIISGLIMLVKDKGRDIAHPAHHGRLARHHTARVLPDGRSDRHGRNLWRLHRGASHLPQHGTHPAVHFMGLGCRSLQPGTLLPCPAPGADGLMADRADRADGAGALVCGNALSVVAGRQARPRRSAQIRMTSMTPALELRGLARSFAEGKGRLEIFKELNLTVRPGEIVALVGQSGSGKSSLLHIAGLLEAPTAGEVLIAGQNCASLDDKARTRIRRIGIGFVYQFHHLLPEFSALENVIIPQLIAGTTKKAATERARELLVRMGLEPRIEHRPSELSGGEQQRVAIARALANRPLLLLADEPTGNLDPSTASRVHEELLRLISEEGLGALVATHNHDLARGMSRIARLEHGRIFED